MANKHIKSIFEKCLDRIVIYQQQIQMKDSCFHSANVWGGKKYSNLQMYTIQEMADTKQWEKVATVLFSLWCHFIIWVMTSCWHVFEDYRSSPPFAFLATQAFWIPYLNWFIQGPDTIWQHSWVLSAPHLGASYSMKIHQMFQGFVRMSWGMELKGNDSSGYQVHS